MKKFRPLIIAAIVLLVLLAGYLLITTLLPEKETDNKADSPTEPVEQYVLTDYEMANVDVMKFKFDDGYEYTIKCVVTKNEKGVSSRNYFIEGKTQYAFNRSTLGMAAMTLADISFTSYVEENPKDLAKYGLDTPYVIFEIVDNDGNNDVIYIGDPAPVGTGYYGMKEGGDKVFLFGSYYSKYMVARDTFYRELAFTQYPDYTSIKSFLLSQPDKETIEIDTNSEEDIKAGGLYATQYCFKQPVQRNGNDSMIAEEIFAKIIAISATEVVEDSLDNLAQYGLDGDNVTILEIGDTEGNTKRLNLSPVGEDGSRYGVIRGIMSVYKFSNSSFSPIFNLDYRLYINKLIWLHNITEVGRVEITLPEGEHILEIFDPTDEEEEAGKEFEATFDGGDIIEENARRLYTRVLSPTFYDMIEGDFEVGEIEYEFKIIYDETGEEHTLQFAPINPRQYVAYLNGEMTDYYVNVSSLTEVSKAVKAIQEGEVLTTT